MTEYAKSKGIRGFKGDILAKNEKMNRLFNQGENVRVSRSQDVYEMVVLF